MTTSQRRKWFDSVVVVGLLLAATACRENSGSKPIQFKMAITGVPEETLSRAMQKEFDYANHFANAERNDSKALVEMVRFSLHTDAAASLGHGVVLAYLISKIGDENFAAAIGAESPNVKKSTLLLLEAGLHSGPNVPNVPMKQFAPLTYRELIKK